MGVSSSLPSTRHTDFQRTQDDQVGCVPYHALNCSCQSYWSSWIRRGRSEWWWCWSTRWWPQSTRARRTQSQSTTQFWSRWMGHGRSSTIYGLGTKPTTTTTTSHNGPHDDDGTRWQSRHDASDDGHDDEWGPG